MSKHDEWMAKHKGEYLCMVGEVWYCDDDDCQCSQAQVMERYQNKVTGNTLVFVRVWEGTFFTDGEAGAEAELATYRAALRDSDPEREASIRWPA